MARCELIRMAIFIENGNYSKRFKIKGTGEIRVHYHCTRR